MFPRIFILVFLVFCSIPSYSAEVIRLGQRKGFIAVSHGDRRAWRNGETLCVFRGNSEIGCGEVIKIGATGAILQLFNPNDEPEIGDSVDKKRSRKTSSEDDEDEDQFSQAKGKKKNLVSAGIYSSFGFVFPQIAFEHAFTPNFAVGIMPAYLRATGVDVTISGFGLFANGTYYPHGYSNGVFIQGGLGMFFLNSTIASIGLEERASPLAFYGTVGWTIKTHSGLIFNGSIGFHYMKEPFDTLELRAAKLKPLGIFSVGYLF